LCINFFYYYNDIPPADIKFPVNQELLVMKKQSNPQGIISEDKVEKLILHHLNKRKRDFKTRADR
jgi:hypothetical protein